MPNSRQFVESLSRGFRLLSIICESKSPMSLSELANAADLSISTIQRLSYTLQQLGLIDRDPTTKRFTIGPRMITLTLTVMQNLELKKIARRYMQKTSDAVGEAVGLGVLSGLEIILIESVTTDQVLTVNMNIGTIIPPHATSLGKAILAYLDAPQVLKILQHGEMTRFTANTVTSVKTYQNQLQRVRERHYALAIDENAYGLSAIGAPIRNTHGQVVASVAIMMPTARFSKEKLETFFSKRIIQTAEEISAALGYRNS